MHVCLREYLSSIRVALRYATAVYGDTVKTSKATRNVYNVSTLWTSQSTIIRYIKYHACGHGLHVAQFRRKVLSHR